MTLFRYDVTLQCIGSVLVLGAGPTGLATAMLLANHGLEVTVLEKDPQAPPDSPEAAWTDWTRPGVAQFRQSHGLLPRGLALLDDRLPAVVGHLRRLGAHPFNLSDAPPPSIEGWAPESTDRRFATLAATRPVYELAFALAAAATPNLEVRRGVRVASLSTGPEATPGVPHVTGVVTDRGESIQSKLLIDAAGRRSPVPAMLEDAGARRPPEADGEFRFVYFTRYYRKTGRHLPQPYVLSRRLSGSVSIGTFPADNDTWSVTLYGTNSDKILRRAKDPDIFERVIRAHPDRSQFVDGQPITSVQVMAGVADRERTMHHDGMPVATGWAPVGDAWACTNPILGRGITMGLLHAIALAPALMNALDAPSALPDAWEAATAAHVRPWYVETRDIDRARSREMDAIRTGQAERHGEGMSREQAAWVAAVGTDPTAYRAQLEVASMLSTSAEIMQRPEIRATIADVAKEPPDLPLPAVPTRATLEAMLTGTTQPTPSAPTPRAEPAK